MLYFMCCIDFMLYACCINVLYEFCISRIVWNFIYLFIYKLKANGSRLMWESSWQLRDVWAGCINIIYELCVVFERAVHVVSACFINVFMRAVCLCCIFSKKKIHLITGKRKLEEKWLWLGLGLGLVLGLFFVLYCLCCIFHAVFFCIVYIALTVI